MFILNLRRTISRVMFFVTAVAVIFSSLGSSLLLMPLPVRAAAAITAVNGTINGSFPGSFVPANSPAIAIMKISVTADAAAQTLTSVTVNFSGTGFAASDLAAMRTDNDSGVALYDDSGGTAGSFDGSDSVVTLAASPDWTPSTTNITLTPATPSALTNGSATIFYVVIKTAAGISNNDEIRATLPANGVVTTNGNGPAAGFEMNYLRADTAAPAIAAVEGFAGSNTLTVRFNKPVRKVGGGNLVLADNPFALTDNGTSAGTSISAISHTEGQNFATVTLSDNLDSGDVDGTPSTLAAGTNKIADFGGTVVATSAVNISSPLAITTPTIPTATVGTVYNAQNPLVTFASQGGLATYSYSANSAADATTLANAGLDFTTVEPGVVILSGTVANIPGSYPLTIKVTDSTGGTPLTATRQFTLNIAASGSGVPGITSATPPGGAQGTNLTVAVTGANTSFSGSSTVQFLLNGSDDTNLVASSITSSSASNLSFSVAIAGGATTGNRDIKITTGSQVVIMPNGFQVFAAGASGLTLLVPSENATGVPLPPGFSFNPSANASVNAYRVTLKSTSNFAGMALWDYTFSKPADAQNTNGSHCSTTSCNVFYGAGTFRILTQPAALAPNTTYYWQVRTYAETTANVSDVATPLEQTPVRGFTTVSSVTDVTPPQIMHRPVFQATESANLDLFARVNDNIATASTSPALTTKIFYCAGSGCSPTTEGAAPTAIGNGYYKYRIPAATVGAAGTIVRYYLQASDGTNTTNFKQPDGTTPFQLTSAAAGAVTIAGSVKDSSDTCAAGVQTATVFAEGTGFSTTTNGSCAYTLSGLTAGSYDLVAVKDGYSDRFISGVPGGATSIAFRLSSGAVGGFGGDTTRPRVKFTGPMDGMTNMPGSDSNFKVFVVFDKSMSQSTITATNLTVNEVNLTTGALTDITTSKGSWTYYPTAPNGVAFVPPEANMAVWSLSSSNTLGDGKTIAVVVSANVTDTAGNSVQGNQSDGSYSFTFTTGTTANFSGFNADTGVFSDGGTFGSGQFVPPFVTGSTPAVGSVGVPTNTKIVISFSEAMADDAGDYLLKNNFKLYSVSGTTETDISSTAVSTVSLDSGKRNATVTLANGFNGGAFAASTKYRAKVLGGAKAATGITLGPPASASSVMYMTDFTTGTGADTTAPTVVGSFPDNAATSVPVNVGTVSVGFSKDMSASTLTTSTLYLSVGSTAVNGTVEYDAIGRQALFIPKSVLSPNTTYTINLTAGIQGLNGQAITASTRTFTTGAADAAQPSVAFVNADDYNLAITFSEPMNAAKATDTLNYAASVVKPGNYALEYGVAGFSGGAGTSLTLPATASLTYDSATNTVTIQGYHDSSITPDQLLGKEILVTVTSVKDLSANAIATASNANKGRSPIANSATTKGALGPGAFAGDAFGQEGGFIPTNFSSTTFGFAPPIEVRPFNMMAGQTTIYGVRLPISTQIPAGGSIVLTFPTGFDVSGAKQDINSPMRSDLNGPSTGTITFKCQTATGGTSCGGGATVTGDAGGDSTTKGGLADDGVVVNTSLRTVAVYLSVATAAAGNDFLTVDLAGIKNSTVPKDFNTSGYTIDIKTKSADGQTLLETLTSSPFFIQSGGSNTISGTITAAGANAGTMKVYLMSPMTGPLETVSDTFSGGSAGYSFSNVPSGDFMLFTDQSITLGATDYSGKTIPERVLVSGNTTYSFTVANASTGGTNVTINIDGPSGEVLDIFAGSPLGFKAKQVTLDGNAGSEAFTINLTDGNWFVGVGPQMPKGFNSGPPPAPSYLPPKPKDVRVTNPTCAVDGVVGCSMTFTLTSATKTIRGLVKDGSSKVIANAEVYAYSPTGGFGTHTTADSAGAFTLNVTDGSYVVGAFVPGMPPSKEVPVTVTSHATTYLLIDGAATTVTPAAAATAFILKVAKPDYTISGKVTDGTNVVQGASVYAYRTDGPGHANALTDSAGAYTLYVSNGNWKVGTFLPQYGNLSELTVVVSGASASNQNFAPTGTGTFRTVAGTVTKGGTAVQGAFVRLSGNNSFNEAITATDGTYSFKVAEGNGYVIRAFLPGVGESAPLAAFNVSGADVSGKDIAMGATRTITVTFSSSVSRAFVELFGSNGLGNRVEVVNATTGTVSLPDGSYTVRVDVPGMQIGLTDIAGTDVNTAYSNTTGIVTVNGNEGLTVTLPTLQIISGTVTDGSSPLSDAWVEISNPANGIHFGTKTASDGTYSLSVAGSATYVLNAMKPGYVREPGQVTVAAADLTGQTLAMTAASTTISGQVLIGSSGAANAFVRAEKQGGGFAGTQADSTGAYTLYVTSGVWSVYAVAEGYAEAAYATNPIDVSGGSVTGKDITLSTAFSLAAPKSKPITPASGGTLEDTTSGVKLNIPANALGSSTSAGNIQSKETNNVRETASAKPLKSQASDGSFVGVAKDIKATDSTGTPITTLNDSVTVEMTYSLAELAATESATDSAINTKAEADTLKMAYWDETTQNWVTKPTTVTYKDSSGDIITDATTIDSAAEFAATVVTVTIAGTTDHFSLYAPVVATDAQAPSTPSGLAATAVSSSQIDLSWTVVSGATSYDIYRSTTSGGTFTRIGSEPTVGSGSTTTYSDTGLTNGATYYYKITSLNASGESGASSEVSATTSAAAGGVGSGGGSAGGSSSGTPVSAPATTETTTLPSSTTTTTTPTPTESASSDARTIQLNQILGDASLVGGAETSADRVAAAVGVVRDAGLEQRYDSTIVARVVVGTTPAATRSAVINFVTYGTASTLGLGAGERAGVVNSYRAAFGRLPTSEADWQDVMKIANGRWPSSTSATRETTAAGTFKRIYLRTAVRTNANDDAAVTVMAYGLRPSTRNLASEVAAIKSFRAIFKKAPSSASDWDAVRAIAYSGAKR